jgi:hypothetical protein
MKRGYETLVEAINELKKEGFTEDFNLCDAGVENKNKKIVHDANMFNVVEYYRFEGLTNPGDSVILYAIETTNGEKGLLLDAYGVYSGNVSPEVLEKLKF